MQTLPRHNLRHTRRLHEPWGARRAWWKRRDDGVSDIVGTTVVLAVTVVLVGAATLTFANGRVESEPAPRVDLRASAAPATLGAVTLKHTGGATVPRADLEAVISTTAWAERVPLPGTGDWELGQEVELTLAHALADGDRVEVLLVSKTHNAVLASSVVDVDDGAVPILLGGSFLVSVTTPVQGTTTSIVGGSGLFVEALVTHPGGRKAIAEVTADLTPVKGSAVTPLYDDGTHGDAFAGDMKYSTYLAIPPDAAITGTPVLLQLRATDLDGAGTPIPFAQGQLSVLIVKSPNTPGPTTLPTVSGFTPTEGYPFTKVTVTGTGFDHVNSVSFVNVAGGEMTGVTWWRVSDTEIQLISPVRGTAVEFHKIRVATPIGPAVSVNSFKLLPLPNDIDQPPTLLGLDPDEGRALDEIVVTGLNLRYVTTTTLQKGDLIYSASFWIEDETGTKLHFLVPENAPPDVYDVVLDGPGGRDVTEPTERFTVLPPPPLTVTGCSPSSGVPFTKVTVTGTGFSDARAVVMNGVTVAWWYVSDSQIQLITNPGVPLGPNEVKVFSTTGEAGKTCFTALEDPNPREYSVYPTDLFAHAAHNTTKYDPGTGGTHAIRSTLKFELLKESIVQGGETMRLAFATLVYQPLKPGDTGTTLIRTITQATCSPPASTDRVGTWTFKWDDSIQSYNKDYATLRYFYEVTWTNGKSGGAYRDFRVVIGSSDTSQYFNLKPLQTTKVVNDVDEWPELPPLTYNSCP